MKKVFSAILSFALVLFMGVAVACSATAISYSVALRNVSGTGLTCARDSEGNWVVKAGSEEDNTLLASGVVVRIKATSGKSDDYKFTVDSSEQDTDNDYVDYTISTSANKEYSVKIECNEVDEDDKPLLSAVEFKIKVVLYEAAEAE